MSVLETVLIVALALVAASLIVAVMMQQGRGAEIGAAFGSGSANTIFGSAGIASPLARLTWGLAIVFFTLSLTLAYLAKQRASGADDLMPSDLPTVPGTPAQTTPRDVPLVPATRVPATSGPAASGHAPLKTPG